MEPKDCKKVCHMNDMRMIFESIENAKLDLPYHMSTVYV